MQALFSKLAHLNRIDYEHRPPEPTSVSAILEPLKSAKLPGSLRHILIKRSGRRIHLADQRQPRPPETYLRRYGKGPSQVKQQPRPESGSESGDYSTYREDRFRPTHEDTDDNKHSHEHEQESSQLAPTIAPSSSKSEDEWEGFARPIELPDGTSKYQCHWRTMDEGIEVNCGYTSKKQLVKRHIETTHLKYRRVSLNRAS
jgi:hypothetical protein